MNISPQKRNAAKVTKAREMDTQNLAVRLALLEIGADENVEEKRKLQANMDEVAERRKRLAEAIKCNAKTSVRQICLRSP